MPRSRFDRLAPERREEILDVAARHFADGGYEGASYNRILEEARLSKGSAYYTFDGKADLYGAVLRRETERMFAALSPPAPARSGAAFWRGVRQWLQDALAFFESHPRTALLVRGYAAERQAGRAPSLDSALEDIATGSMRELILGGRAAGAVRDDVDEDVLASLATGTIAALDYHFLHRLLEMTAREREDLLDLYVDTLERLLRPRGSRAAHRPRG